MSSVRRWAEEAARDSWFALRVLRRKPAFTLAALLSLALGAGVNTAVFSLADRILFHPLDVPDSGRLVSVYHRDPKGATVSSSWPDYEHYRDNNRVLSGLAAYLRVPMVLRTREGAGEIRGELVSGNFFQVLGVRPLAGRAFSGADRGAVAVLSYDCWQRRFAGDSGVVGSTAFLGGHAFTIIGIAPAGFRGVVMDWGGPPDLWVQISAYREAVPVFAKFDVTGAWNMQSFPLVGRLRPGESVESARAAFAVLSAQAAPLREAALKRKVELNPLVLPLQQARFWPTYRPAAIRFLSVMSGVAVLLLLIACLNVAGLLVALASERKKEIMVRLALGVSRGRLLRQLLVESLILSALGGLAGLLVADWTTRFLVRFPGAFGAPVVLTGGLDWRAFAFALLVSGISGLVFGLAPARHALRLAPAGSLRGDIPASGRGPSLRSVLLAAQVALSLVVVVGAGLFVRTLRKVQSEDSVRDPARLMVGKLDLASWGYDQPGAASFYGRLLESVREVPGVRSAALANTLPLAGMRSEAEVSTGDGRPVRLNLNVVSDGHFQVAGFPLLRGRDFSSRDRDGAPRVAVVNEQAAESLWPGEEALGRRLRVAGATEPVEVVGVVRDGKFRNLREPLLPCLYLPLGQVFRWGVALEIRTAFDPLASVAAIRAALSALDKELPLTGVMTWEGHRNASLAQERLATALLGGLGLLGLALAAVGVYGIVSFLAVRRTREIGIRLALGARRSDVFRSALAGGGLPVLAGVVAGSAAALLVTRHISALLYETDPADPVAFLGAGLVMLAIGAAGGCIPALRAARLDPSKALRYE